MSRHYGGTVGGVVVPSSLLAPGVWRPSEVARQLAGASSGLLWPSAEVDPNFASVVLLCHFNEWTANGRLTDKSASGNHLSLHASGSVSAPIGLSTTSPKFGQYSFNISANTIGGLFTDSPASSNFLFGTGDVTAEGWFYLTASGLTRLLFDFRTSDVSVIAPTILLNAGDNKLRYYYNAAVGSLGITGTNAVSLNTWHHIHWTRASGVSYLGMDGVQEGADFTDSNNFNSHNMCCLGHAASGTPSSLVGRIQEIRVTKGVAVYARTYTVPTAPFPDH